MRRKGPDGEDVMDSETVTITSGDAGTSGTSAGLQTDDVINWTDLLHGLLIPSGNDAAAAIARVIGTEIFDETSTGTTGEERFVEEMNALATELGLSDTTFASPNGFPSTDDESSARDLAILAAAAFADPIIRAVANTASYGMTITGANARTENISHTSRLLGFDGILAVKTGAEGSPGTFNNAVLWESPNGTEVVIITLQSTQSGDDRDLDVWGILLRILRDFPYLCADVERSRPGWWCRSCG